MNKEELAIVEQLDNGSLYSTPSLVNILFSHRQSDTTKLAVSYDDNGKPRGYIPIGYHFGYGEKVYAYLATIPGSAPISSTYTPGAKFVLSEMLLEPINYIEGDIITDFDILPICSEVLELCFDTPVMDIGRYAPTASAYCLPLENYWKLLSVSRRKDFRRKLNASKRYTIEAGDLNDIVTARPWVEQRRAVVNEYNEDSAIFISNILEWLHAIEASKRATLKIDKYLLDGEVVGVNCCVIHSYNGNTHCDDYLTWHDAKKSSGLGIVSAIRNLTDPDMQGFRYNLGTPSEVDGVTLSGHEYKWDLIPKNIRLSQSVIMRMEDSWCKGDDSDTEE